MVEFGHLTYVCPTVNSAFQSMVITAYMSTVGRWLGKEARLLHSQKTVECKPTVGR